MVTNESLRSKIAIVPQRIDLFSGNVIDNIAVGEFYPDMDRLIHICDQLGITTFIEQLPYGLQTYLGENGASLSGGQKQRLAIARALYREPEILILDEATSSLDTVAEGFVRKTISLLREQKKTIVIIAHRLSTIMHVDKVVVLDQGKLIQEGTVNELSEREGKFRDMFIKDYYAVQTT
jgi:ATP-binding cassette, subfamily C, bacteriocin exporter